MNKKYIVSSYTPETGWFREGEFETKEEAENLKNKLKFYPKVEIYYE